MKSAKNTILALSLTIVLGLGFYFYRVYNSESIQDTIIMKISEKDPSFDTKITLIGRGVLEELPTGTFEISEESSSMPRATTPDSLYLPNDEDYLNLIKEYPRFFRGRGSAYNYKQVDEWLLYFEDYFVGFDNETEKEITLEVAALDKESKDIISGLVTIRSDEPISFVTLESVQTQSGLAYLSYRISTTTNNYLSLVQYDMENGEQKNTVSVPNIEFADGYIMASDMHVISESEVIYAHTWEDPKSNPVMEETSEVRFYDHYRVIFQRVDFDSLSVEELTVPEQIQVGSGKVIVLNNAIHNLTYSNGLITDHSYDLAAQAELPRIQFRVDAQVFDSLYDAIVKTNEDGTVYIAESTLWGDKQNSGIVVLDLLNKKKVLEGKIVHKGNQLSSIYFENFK